MKDIVKSDLLPELRDIVENFKESRNYTLCLTARFDDFHFTQELLYYCKKENISISSDFGFKCEFSIKRKQDDNGNWIYRNQIPLNFEIELDNNKNK